MLRRKDIRVNRWPTGQARRDLAHKRGRLSGQARYQLNRETKNEYFKEVLDNCIACGMRCRSSY